MKYCFLFLKNVKIIHSVRESKINKSPLLFMIQYFILPILLYNPITDVIMASPPAGKQKISQSNFLVKHNPLPSFPVEDCDLKQWIMKSQERTSHYTPQELRLMGEEARKELKYKYSF